MDKASVRRVCRALAFLFIRTRIELCVWKNPCDSLRGMENSV